MGITEDGRLRNVLGMEGEAGIKKPLSDWLSPGRQVPCHVVRINHEYLLGQDRDVRMLFSAEPDIEFQRRGPDGWETVSTIEIKSGRDPAGALERLGAIRKSFEETPAQSRNFAVLGVTTPEMESRLKEMRVERVFNLWAILEGRDKAVFINEIFHYTLRLLDEPLR